MTSMYRHFGIGLSAVIVAITIGLYAADQHSSDKTNNKTKNPIEVGIVSWKRDLDAALKESKETKKPVFLLFQEVPG